MNNKKKAQKSNSKSEPWLPVPRPGKIHSINGVPRNFTIEDEIVCKQGVRDKGTRKRICFQKIHFEDHGKIEYRLTYYMQGVKPGAKGRWVFGQYSLMIPVEKMAFLIREAKKRNWAGF